MAYGGDVKVKVAGSAVTLEGAQNSAKVTKADITGGNSVIHVIDNVSDYVILTVTCLCVCVCGGRSGGLAPSMASDHARYAHAHSCLHLSAQVLLPK